MNLLPSKAKPLLALGAVTGLAALLLAGLGNASQAAEQPSQSPPQVVQLQPSLVERLRKLLGITTPRVAVGGSRSGGDDQICLISPLIRQTSNALPAATTALRKPTLLAAEELNELRIERDGQILWRQRATSTTALAGPIPWPLDPLRPGERVTLWLRPRGSAGGDFAKVALIAAGTSQQQNAETLLNNPRGRLAAVQAAATAGDDQLALELLYAPLDPVPPAVAQLRQQLIQQACGLPSRPTR
ncbi:hypothetical protein [Cyanobium sp. A2C-AMD]|uniref:hypothetical protein n=1 Tax=Cyanobium sp. A2C-AMD TaxID=2823695 RepID=UPI0020CF54FB|nr:hypothetical protein [Cyanobium sp. A2C-AMD]MCP9878058.1 hypothetical protein [Cyanobium sp. A2C-AMD]